MYNSNELLINESRAHFLRTIQYNWKRQLVKENYLLWENNNLNEADTAEDKKYAGHISPETIVNFFRVLKKRQRMRNQMNCSPIYNFSSFRDVLG